MSVAKDRSAPVRSALLRIAPPKRALKRLAFVKSAFVKSTLNKSDPVKLNQVCLSDPDGANSFVLSDFYAIYAWMTIDSSPDGSELIVAGLGGRAILARVPVDRSAIFEITPYDAPVAAKCGDIDWFELPPSVATLTPTNQTITVFLLGRIAFALVMRGRKCEGVNCTPGRD